MRVESAGMIAARLVAYKLTGTFPDPDPYDCGNSDVGKFALEVICRYALKQNIRFDGMRAEMGRVAQAIRVQQRYLHEFMIEYVLPYVIAEGFTATGHIDFKWSDDKNPQ